ncbi:MAG: hypothetical protein Q9213_001889 [Squamulea squamosa]
MSTASSDEASFYGLGRDFSSTTRSVFTIWLVDLAEQLPHAQLDGYDISSSQWPPAEWLPSNVKLKTLDALAIVPNHLVEKYDVIHIGLLVLVARDDPKPLLKNVLSMLKPGGYLQWDEADLGGLYRSTTGPSASKASLDALFKMAEERFNLANISFRQHTQPKEAKAYVAEGFVPNPTQPAFSPPTTYPKRGERRLYSSLNGTMNLPEDSCFPKPAKRLAGVVDNVWYTSQALFMPSATDHDPDQGMGLRDFKQIAHPAFCHNIIILSDEVYEHLYYTASFPRIATLSTAIAARTITIGSVGKSFNATGWRVGYAIGDKNLIMHVKWAHALLSYVTPGPAQEAAAVAYEKADNEGFWESNKQLFNHKVDRLCQFLDELGLPVGYPIHRKSIQVL